MSKVVIIVVASVLAGLIFPIAAITLLMAGVIAPIGQAAGDCNASFGALTSQLQGSGTYRLPLTGHYRVSSDFGWRTHPVTGEHKLHRGLDLSMSPHGGPALAMGAGTISRLSSGGSGGNIVTIDHGGGLQSKYMHLRAFAVTAGQSVVTGQQVGIEGATGRVTGAHLHWEVWVNGSAVDPRKWAATHGLTVEDSGVAPPISALPAADNRLKPDGPATTTEGETPSPTGVLPKVIGAFVGEQIVNAAHILVAGRKLGLDDHTLALGVTTAIGESSLVNIDKGDKAGPDSRGLFQQRANGAWGSYADRMNPEIAATNFFKALVKVPGYRELPPTIAIHRTQRNADPYHYAKFWAAGALITATLLKNPGLLNQLPASAMTADCTSAALNIGPVPPGPNGECPATSSAGEHGLQPSALRGLRCGAASFPKIHTMYGIGSRGGKSDHPAGNAVDFMLDNYRRPEMRAYGWQLAEWTRANAENLHVKYIIFDMKFWRPGQENWRPYTRYGPDPDDNLAHRNHVHVSYRA